MAEASATRGDRLQADAGPTPPGVATKVTNVVRRAAGRPRMQLDPMVWKIVDPPEAGLRRIRRARAERTAGPRPARRVITRPDAVLMATSVVPGAAEFPPTRPDPSGGVRTAGRREVRLRRTRPGALPKATRLAVAGQRHLVVEGRASGRVATGTDQIARTTGRRGTGRRLRIVRALVAVTGRPVTGGPVAGGAKHAVAGELAHPFVTIVPPG